jgi:5-methylcytosine-specific restriction protein B
MDKTTWLLRWNPDLKSEDPLTVEEYRKIYDKWSRNEKADIDWSFTNKKGRKSKGEEVYLIKASTKTTGAKGIIAHGFIDKESQGKDSVHISFDIMLEIGKGIFSIDSMSESLKNCYFLKGQQSGVKFGHQEEVDLLEKEWKRFLEEKSIKLEFRNKNIDNNLKKPEEKEVNNPKNIILYGPPGTGKTYNTARYAVELCGKEPNISNLDSQDVLSPEKYEKLRNKYKKLINDNRIIFITFHQSYGYEEFIEGIKPKMNEADHSKLEYRIEDGVFKKFCITADSSCVLKEQDEAGDDKSKSVPEQTGAGVTLGQSNQTANNVVAVADNEKPKEDRDDEPQTCVIGGETHSEIIDKNGNAKNKDANNFVFIIDEINRGNISKIFGELITLIESNKRLGGKEETRAVLPYSGDRFAVPGNVYILGTMNTADRSIALMDTALRRRFHFIEMIPNTKILKDVTIKDGSTEKVVNIMSMLDTINKRIEYLYDREHTIGHGFFTSLIKEENRNKDNLKDIFKNKIIPLLQEYFYDDYKKIQLVLGDDDKIIDEKYKFIKEISDEKESLFKGSDDNGFDIPQVRYEINPDAFEKIESYIKIYKPSNDLKKISENTDAEQ